MDREHRKADKRLDDERKKEINSWRNAARKDDEEVDVEVGSKSFRLDLCFFDVQTTDNNPIRSSQLLFIFGFAFMHKCNFQGVSAFHCILRMWQHKWRQGYFK